MRRLDAAVSIDDARSAWERAQQASEPGDGLKAGCELITPMYGGGVTAGEVDVDLPVRPSALRGQLRYWWRLLNDQGQDSKALFTAESELWGGITKTGPRASRVTLQLVAKPVDDGRLTSKSRVTDFPAYALILEPRADPHLLNAGYRFEVTLRFASETTPAQRDQVIEALRWWATFGGVGARTRRGLGAVRISPPQTELTAVDDEEVAAHGGRLLLGALERDAHSAWEGAVATLKDFRQGVNVGRNPGKGDRPGQSRWPEPDILRQLTGHYAPHHRPKRQVDVVYPRAAFGLPVIFHFKDPGEPQDQTLEPAGDSDRMASPLILRPYADGRGYRPAALLLPGWEQCICVSVKSGDRAPRPAWPNDTAERERLAAEIRPMQEHGTDVLSAFMDYFAKVNK